MSIPRTAEISSKKLKASQTSSLNFIRRLRERHCARLHAGYSQPIHPSPSGPSSNSVATANQLAIRSLHLRHTEKKRPISERRARKNHRHKNLRSW